MIFDEHVLAWLRTHHSTITTESAVGEPPLLRPDERRRLVTAGMLRRVVNGAYVFGGANEDEIPVALRSARAGRRWSSQGRRLLGCGSCDGRPAIGSCT